tara:strand:- start:1136 stop:1375 length:240 start_codon:yes stop_codon:yes gene_type:complete
MRKLSTLLTLALITLLGIAATSQPQTPGRYQMQLDTKGLPIVCDTTTGQVWSSFATRTNYGWLSHPSLGEIRPNYATQK